MRHQVSTLKKWGRCFKQLRKEGENLWQSLNHTLHGAKISPLNINLVGFNPFETYESKWVHLPQMDVNIKKYLKPPPSNGWMKIYFGIQPILQGLLLLLSSREATWKIIPGRT